MLNWECHNTAKKPIQKQLFVELTEKEQLVFDFLTGNGKELLDLISLNCKLPIHQTTALLFNLEMKGMVKPLPGKLYEAI